jgi:ABC-type branched-subunit amino acid transport system ATPase component
MSAPLLEVEGIGVTFGGYVALDAVSFAVAEGHIHALIGPNGAGKTTLFNVISGLLRPDAGLLRFRAAAYAGLRADRVLALGIARNFQQVRLFPALSAIENVMVGCHSRLPRTGLADFLLGPFGRATADTRAADHAKAMLELVEYRGAIDGRPQQMTLVDQRRIEIARALASDPQLLLLDEPAAGMNPPEARQLSEIIQKIRRLGRTVLLVEHNTRLVFAIADQVTVLSAGRIIASNAAEAVKGDPSVIAAYLGNV